MNGLTEDDVLVLPMDVTDLSKHKVSFSSSKFGPIFTKKQQL
jgi:hypothetical protein